MPAYAEDYAKEEQLYTLYMAKAAHHKRRMDSIKCLMEGSQDGLDEAASLLIGTSALGASISTKSSEAQNAAEPKHESDPLNVFDGKYPKKKMSDKTITLFQYIGLEGKSLPQLMEFTVKKNLGWKDHNIRNMMMQYRKNYEFIESPKNGFYQLTQKGYNAVQKQFIENSNVL